MPKFVFFPMYDLCLKIGVCLYKSLFICWQKENIIGIHYNNCTSLWRVKPLSKSKKLAIFLTPISWYDFWSNIKCLSFLHISQRFWAIFNFIGIIYTNKQFFLQYNNRYVKSNIKSNLHNSCWKKPNPYSRCQTCENRACHMTTIFATALGVFVWRKTSISTTTHYRSYCHSNNSWQV